MLEKIIEKGRIRHQIIDLQPSSNNLFSSSGSLENAIFTPFTILRDEFPHNNLLLYSSFALTCGIYLPLEIVSRVSESIVRGTGRGLKYLITKLYNCFDKEERSSVKQFVNQVSQLYSGTKQKLKNFFDKRKQNSINPAAVEERRKFCKDLAVVGLSTYLCISGLDSIFSEKKSDEVNIRPTTENSARAEDYRLDDMIMGRTNNSENSSEQPRYHLTNNSPAENNPQRGIYNRPREIRRQRILTDQLNNFSNRKVLVYCANSSETNYVLQTLRQRNNLRRRDFRMRFVRENGITKAIMPNRTGNGSIRTSEIYVVNSQNQGIPTPAGGYNIIQLRGHTDDMLNLFNKSKNYASNHVIYVLGGCNSTEFVSTIARANRAVIGGDGSQNGVYNTYLLLRLINEQGKVRTWNELNSRISNLSSRASQFVFPENRNYIRHVN